MFSRGGSISGSGGGVFKRQPLPRPVPAEAVAMPVDQPVVRPNPDSPPSPATVAAIEEQPKRPSLFHDARATRAPRIYRRRWWNR